MFDHRFGNGGGFGRKDADDVGCGAFARVKDMSVHCINQRRAALFFGFLEHFKVDVKQKIELKKK